LELNPSTTFVLGLSCWKFSLRMNGSNDCYEIEVVFRENACEYIIQCGAKEYLTFPSISDEEINNEMDGIWYMSQCEEEFFQPVVKMKDTLRKTRSKMNNIKIPQQGEISVLLYKDRKIIFKLDIGEYDLRELNRKNNPRRNLNQKLNGLFHVNHEDKIITILFKNDDINAIRIFDKRNKSSVKSNEIMKEDYIKIIPNLYVRELKQLLERRKIPIAGIKKSVGG